MWTQRMFVINCFSTAFANISFSDLECISLCSEHCEQTWLRYFNSGKTYINTIFSTCEFINMISLNFCLRKIRSKRNKSVRRRPEGILRTFIVSFALGIYSYCMDFNQIKNQQKQQHSVLLIFPWLNHHLIKSRDFWYFYQGCWMTCVGTLPF